MNENEWVLAIPSKVFTRIKDGFSPDVKTKLKMSDKNFSAVSSADKTAVFPFVFVRLLSADERGGTLDGENINGGMFTFQVDVTDNKTQERAVKAMSEVMRIMKEMRFLAVSLPIFDNVDNTYRMIARFRRIIGYSDEF